MMTDKENVEVKMSAAEKTGLQAQLDYAQKCHDNTSVLSARTYWANMISMLQKALSD